MDSEGTKYSSTFHFKGSKRYRLILTEKKKKIKRQSLIIQFKGMDTEFELD